MKRPSFTLIFSAIFIAYILHSIWTLAQLFIPPDCEASGLERCLNAYITSIPALGLLVYTSTRTRPYNNADVQLVHSNTNFDYNTPFERELTFDVPSKTHRNGSLYMHVAVFVPSSKKPNKIPSWEEVQRQEGANFLRISVTRYALPKMEMFKLLTEKKSENKPNKMSLRPVTHIKKNVAFCMLSDPISFSTNNLPLEIARNMVVTKRGDYLPILQYDFVRSRLKDLEQLTSSNKTITVTFSYSPIGIGKLRLLIQLETAMASLITLGFTEKDVDEVKSIIADTNVYLLCATVFIGSMHLLFDFLAFKNDVSFWRNKKSHEGLSARAVLWRAFSQAVIFLYLLDENTSLLVLIPSGIAMLIEFWKTKKIFKIKITFVRLLPRVNFQTKNETEAERKTNQYDAESMKYLSYVLYPLCIAGAIYSLLYESHKSWYSWTVHSIVNGVYAFGFLFMLPQLFVNYRLKSVAALPWRAFMYKAFNTFIDDVFAFIITMPTAHRFACFRDDIVFLIYLYQRWLYPVDKSRIDDSSRVFVDKDSQDLIEKKKK